MFLPHKVLDDFLSHIVKTKSVRIRFSLPVFSKQFVFATLVPHSSLRSETKIELESFVKQSAQIVL